MNYGQSFKNLLKLFKFQFHVKINYKVETKFILTNFVLFGTTF